MIGDAVNLASRVESLNNYLQTQVLIFQTRFDNNWVINSSPEVLGVSG